MAVRQTVSREDSRHWKAAMAFSSTIGQSAGSGLGECAYTIVLLSRFLQMTGV